MAGRRRVIYLNWDGFAWEYFEEALRRGRAYPGLQRLAREGTVFARAHSGIPSLTVPMQTSLVTGAWPAVHGNTFRYLDRATGRVVESGRRNDAETIAEACRRNGLSVAAVNQFTLKGRGTSPEDPQSPYLDAGSGYRERFAAARRMWAAVRPDLLCLYCDELDAVGHNFAWRSGTILRAGTERQRRGNLLRQLRGLDRQLARWMKELSPTGPPRGVVVALAADHGMTPYHGPSSLPAFLRQAASLGLPVQVCGPGERPGSTDGLAIVTLGLQLQIYFLGAAGPRAEQLTCTLIHRLYREPWFGGALSRAELLERGAHPDFADLLLWPKPPHHFKPGVKPYPVRGQHDSLDVSSSHVFLALWGDGIRPQTRIAEEVWPVDLAPTLAALLGIDPPRQSAGRVLVETMSAGSGRGCPA
ncbi:MAG: alkaline phosphatase family protein [Betaproteobacteria bacterium]